MRLLQKGLLVLFLLIFSLLFFVKQTFAQGSFSVPQSITVNQGFQVQVNNLDPNTCILFEISPRNTTPLALFSTECSYSKNDAYYVGKVPDGGILPINGLTQQGSYTLNLLSFDPSNPDHSQIIESTQQIQVTDPNAQTNTQPAPPTNNQTNTVINFNGLTGEISPNPITPDSGSVSIKITSPTPFTYSQYSLSLWTEGGSDSQSWMYTTFIKQSSPNEITGSIPLFNQLTKAPGNYVFRVWVKNGSSSFPTGSEIDNSGNLLFKGAYTVLPPGGSSGTPGGGVGLAMDCQNFQANTDAKVYIMNAVTSDPSPLNFSKQYYDVWFNGDKTLQFSTFFVDTEMQKTNYSDKTGVRSINVGNPGTKQVCLDFGGQLFNSALALTCRSPIKIIVTAQSVDPAICKPITSNVNNTASANPTPTLPPPPCSKFVKKDGSEPPIEIKNPLDRTEIDNAFKGKDWNDWQCEGLATGVGLLSSSPLDFVKTIFAILLGLSGGIAVLLIIYSGYRMVMSQGNPQTIEGARETLTSAIIGLVFSIFSLVILEIIGVDILKIPGFGGTPLTPQQVRNQQLQGCLINTAAGEVPYNKGNSLCTASDVLATCNGNNQVTSQNCKDFGSNYICKVMSATNATCININTNQQPSQNCSLAFQQCGTANSSPGCCVNSNFSCVTDPSNNNIYSCQPQSNYCNKTNSNTCGSDQYCQTPSNSDIGECRQITGAVCDTIDNTPCSAGTGYQCIQAQGSKDSTIGSCQKVSIP